MLQPEMSGLVLADKIASIRDANPRPELIATGNPGCIMQIGAGLQAADLSIPVVHPVELLDLSYAGAGLYA
jgi:glycolate oxidase iron-sulfur subunit